jgi:hypothetical protein
MAHKVNIFDVKAGFDANGWMSPVRVVETDDPDEAIRIAREELDAARSIRAVSVKADWRLCADLGAYFRLENAVADWHEANPIEGSWVGRLVDDPAHWAEYGVHTPEQVEKHLLLDEFSDTYKEMHGFRPRGTGLTMESPIEEIEAACAGLRQSFHDDGPQP